ncbi:MAG: cobaltochelatase subunit CobN, partial [Chloroflexi bacterium]|nr:cobaltochelatase subunit CobN [Chloroflexota bacterium]
MILYLTTADTEILTLTRALRELPSEFPAVRAYNPATLAQAGALERFFEEDVPAATAVVLRLLGGKRPFAAGFDRLAAACREREVPFVALPGDQQPDLDLSAATTVAPDLAARLFTYLLHGGVRNFVQMLRFVSDELHGTSLGYDEPQELPWDGIYHPSAPSSVDLADYLARLDPALPTVGVLFYRAHWMSGNLDFIDALIAAIESHRCNVIPVFLYSLKSGAIPDATLPASSATPSRSHARTFTASQPHTSAQSDYVLERYFVAPDGSRRVDVIVNTLSFATANLEVRGATVASGWSVEYLDQLDVPVLQAVNATSTRAEWESHEGGLSPIDTAMNVAMPEFDGRLITVPISFKETVDLNVTNGVSGVGSRVLGNDTIAPTPSTQHPIPIVKYVPDLERVDYVARLAARWALLHQTPNSEKRIALILANYPSKAGRIGNAVGLDTPASVVALLHALAADGYHVEGIPECGDALMHALADGCSYDLDFLTPAQMATAAGRVPAATYAGWHDGFTPPVRATLAEAWGAPPGRVYTHDGHLYVPGLRFGNVFVGVQPPRGFGDNPIAIYHSPDLAPPHHYLAYYRWLRDDFGAHAVVHVGKHGNLEWLPGKALGLSASCFPEVALNDLPHFYPFIVNNPGEGTQAKRRAHATILDHLIPSMQTADSYNEISRVEQLMDEYYQVQT